MSRCLGERTLWLVREGEGRADQHAHLRACPRCAARYERLAGDLAVVQDALRAAPSETVRPAAGGSLARRRLAVAAILALAIGLGGAEAWRWYQAAPPGLADTLPFLAEVSAALTSTAEGPTLLSSTGRPDPLFVMEALSDPGADGEVLLQPETQGGP